MKRRSFFGLMGGAAVAGPSAAKAALGELPKSLGGSIPSFGGYASQMKAGCGSDTDWRVAEVKRLQRLLTGNLTDEEKEDRKRRRMYQQEAIISQNVTALVSISPASRMRLYHREMEAHQARVEKSELSSNLFRLLKEMGK